MKWARIENGIVMEIIDVEPIGRYTEEIVNQFNTCEDDTEQGDIFEEGIYSKPQIIPPSEIDTILIRLSQLNLVIDSQTEQIYTDLGKLPSYQPIADAMLEKQSLRQRLQDLESE